MLSLDFKPFTVIDTIALYILNSLEYLYQYDKNHFYLTSGLLQLLFSVNHNDRPIVDKTAQEVEGVETRLEKEDGNIARNAMKF